MAELKGPLPNRFRQFSNMTYGVSIYLQNHKQYVEMLKTGKKDVSGLELLVQSGGASTSPSDAQTGTTYNYGAKRNEFFTRDFFLDDIQLQSLISGTATGSANNSFELNFSVTEPMGLTFTDRLFKAATENAKAVGIEDFNPLSQIYLMVIRFYGYDKYGKQVLNGKFDEGSDPNSYVEKWVPFMITKLSFAVETSKVVYQVQCVCPETQIAQGQIHGTIPYNVGTQGKTLEEILTGTDGLVETLNNYQKEHYGQGANVYDIEFEEDVGLRTAKMAPLGTPSIARSGQPAKNSPGAKSKASTNAAQVNKEVQSLSANAGMHIMKFIDLAVRSSTFMSSQYRKMHDQNKDKSTKPRATPKKPLLWYKIRPRIDEVLGFDKKRQSYYYKIVYVVTTYPVRSVESFDFTTEESCFKTHKEYDVWFTGKNTEVLEFRQDYNTMYFISFGSKELANPELNPSSQNNLHMQKAHRVNSIEAQTGENQSDEQAANAASILYSPADVANIELDILGDPDWLSQSELFYAATTNPGDPTLRDGSINYDSSEVYFQVNFNTVVDYELDTGLADVTQKNVGKSLDGRHPGGVAQYAFVYRANTITTQLEKGKFVQQIQGTLVFVPEACITGLPEDPEFTDDEFERAIEEERINNLRNNT